MVLACAGGISNHVCVLCEAKKLCYHTNYNLPSLAPPDVGVICHLCALMRYYLARDSTISQPLCGTCLLRLKSWTKVGVKPG